MTTVREETQAETAATSEFPSRSFRVRDFLALALWLGLAAGWVEVLTKIGCAAIGLHGRLYMMSRHFVWLIPVSDVLIFGALGLLLAPLVVVAPRAGRWLAVRVLVGLAIVPAMILLVPGIYTVAWFLMGFGMASQVVPLLSGRGPVVRRLAAWSFPAMAIGVMGVAGWMLTRDLASSRREAARPLPPAGSPNVLMIVMDTVRADRLSVYGYPRPTSPSLEYLGMRGVRFNAARSTSSWTLPSHGSMFTGELPGVLGADWLEPIRTDLPTLAGHLANNGYATAGFVGNTLYCSYDTGLAEGFAHYEDYNLRQMDWFLTSQLGEKALQGFFRLSALAHARGYDRLIAPMEGFVQSYVFSGKRKTAEVVNGEFSRWLATRDASRPFFAFLNYIDAHDTYFPPSPDGFVFGTGPRSAEDLYVLQNWESLDKRGLPDRFRRLASDSYDNCVRYIDDQLGALLRNLSAQNLLRNTVVVVTADHGENFGEHGLYRHGNSLYDPAIRVPLLIVTPSTSTSPKVIDDVVSLTDLPATLADLTGTAEGSPLPGRSLKRTWAAPPSEADARHAVSELFSPNPVDIGHQAPSPAIAGPVVALTSQRYKYITNGARDELYDLKNDPGETTNLAASANHQEILEAFRDRARQPARR